MGGYMRKTLLLLLIFMSIVFITGCRRSPANNDDDVPGEKISLRYWNSLTGADGTVMRQLVQQFNQAHEDQIEVIETFTNEIDYYTNINLLVPMGRGPDIAIMHSYLVQSYANSKILVPYESYLEVSDVDIKGEDYISDVFNSLYFEDELYGIPLDLHAVGFYYNKDLLNKYELSVPTTRSEMISAAKIVQEGEKAEGKTVWGLPLSTTWPSEWIFTAALYQNNGLEIDQNGNPAYHSAEGVSAMHSVANLIHVEKISPTNLGVDQDLFLFQTGQALFHIQGSWMLNSIKESGINFGVFPVSNMFNEDGEAHSNHIPARSHTFVLTKPSGTPSDARKEAMMTFIKYIGDNSFLWAQAGQIPASNIARANQDYLSIEYIHDFGAINHFRVSAQSPYFHQAFSPVYSRMTAAMANPNFNANNLLAAAVEEALMLLAEARS
jgi:multiple sugar transport system substrate-binding protein